MTSSELFFEHLRTITNDFSSLKNAYDKYKKSPNNECFRLNGLLRTNQPLCSELGQLKTQLNPLFRAKNNNRITLYRMTSHNEFTPSGVAVELKIPFRYPAFLSTTMNESTLRNFVPSIGTPTILNIECPPNTIMAFMEMNPNDTTEDERLLPANTEFKLMNAEKITCYKCIQYYVGKHRAEKHPYIYLVNLTVTDIPNELKGISDTEFFNFTN